MNTTAQVISPEHLLKHWQGHRALTRHVIEAFPEKDFFEFSIGGMRPFAKMASALLSIEEPALTTKAQFLQKWDEATEEINQYWKQIPMEDFGKNFNLFGQYEFPIIENIFYFIDNEIHHRGQGYVYLRALGSEPQFFWTRE